MGNKKQLFIIFLFLLLSGSVLWFSLKVEEKDIYQSTTDAEGQEDTSSRFVDLIYFNTINDEKKLYLEARKLDILESQKLFFVQPDGKYFHEPDNPIYFKADKGNFFTSTRLLNLRKNVSVSTTTGSRHDADRLTYNGTRNIFVATGDTTSYLKSKSGLDTIKVMAERVVSTIDREIVLFKEDVKAVIKRRRVYEGKVNLTADVMRLNRRNSTIFLEGNITMKRNNYYLQAERADIFLNNFNKTLKYYVLYDDIKLQEELHLDDGTRTTRRAYSEKLEGFMREGKIIMTGAPRVIQENDLIKGYRITLRENVELVEVDDSQTNLKLKGAN